LAMDYQTTNEYVTPTTGYVVYHAQEAEELAKRIGVHFLKLHKNSKYEILPLRWGKFPDGTENSELLQVHKVENRHVLFIATFSSPDEKLRQLSAIYVLCRRHIKSLTVLLPFSPSATMERIDAQEGVIATADVDAHFFSTMPSVRGGPIKLVIYDLHTLQNRFYFRDSTLAKLVSAVPLLKNELAKLTEPFTIAFPDEGALKRFGRFFENVEPIVCGKVRTPDNQRIVTINDGNPSGKHVVIVDDLCQTGGTLIACRDVLFAKGARKVSAYCTHAIFPKESWKRFTEKDVFETFWITNTYPVVAQELSGKKPFKVIDITEHFASQI